MLTFAAGVLVWLAPSGLRAAGRFLVIADPLEPSGAIVIMAGEVPFRQIEAAKLFHRRLAPWIVLTREAESAWQRKLRQFGVAIPERREIVRQVLVRLDVPPDAIRYIADPAVNTADEMKAVRRFAAREGLRRIIIVSSPDHLRRIRVIWTRGVEPGVEVRLHPAPEEDGFDPDTWWTTRRGAENLAHEYAGIVNFLLGSPIRSGW